jgi:alkanesulfonate monooxygenase SsuD/methylene tetrahydromethanopterin reductase-like flavin-dependent oxidoreductase (luciferase family)
LQKLSDGRMFLGVGTGDLALIQLGQRPAKVADLETYARALKALMNGESVEVDGKRFQIAAVAKPVPLWLGADGPRMLELAGRMADGVIVGQASHPDIVRYVHANLARGASAAGRNVDEIDVWYTCRIDISDEPNAAVRKPGLDRYAARQANFLWRIAGYPPPEQTRAAVLAKKGLELSDDVAHRLAEYGSEFSQEKGFTTNYNVDLLAKHGLTDWAGELLYLSGPADHVIKRMRGLMAAGARNFVVPLIGANSLEERMARSRLIAPVFDSLRNGELTGWRR